MVVVASSRVFRARVGALVLALGLVTGCKPETPARPEARPTAQPDRVQSAVIDRVRAGLRSPQSARFRAMQVFAQAEPGVLAVCGQVNANGNESEPYIPFVSVVASGTDGTLRIEQSLASTTGDATRVYGLMVSRCFEGGGPRPTGTGRPIQPPIPPLPNGLPIPGRDGMPVATAPSPAMQATAPVAQQSAPRPPDSPAVAAASQGSVASAATPRQNANLRLEPRGGSPVIRVVPRSVELRILGEAPGGWYQVGDAEPWGWIHGSLLDVR